MPTDPSLLTPPPGAEGVERTFGVDNVLRALGIDLPLTRCGRYELCEKIGEGGMGVVYRAHDPELDRWVAIKILREDTDGDARARLRREAQALARLSDPRVVTVLAVGEQRGQTWIAMELVRGPTLADWAKAHADDTPGRHRAALEILTEAGRGLGAAHRAGLVHRDFKPANVLLAEDGRVKIADFGLARPAEEQRTRTDPEASAPVIRPATTWAGTPAYMAPEQHLGLPVDARCDQYAFAVTAWELLSGAPAFRARTLVDLAQAKLDRMVEVDAPLPRPIRRVLLRALSPAPEDRFHDMAELLEALHCKRSPRTRAFALGLAAAVSTTLWFADDTTPEHPCARLQAPRWTAQDRTALRASFLRDGALNAPEAWNHLDTSLTDYAKRWARARDASCAHGSRRETAAVAACLDRAARTFDAAVSSAQTDPSAALRGPRMVEELLSLHCDMPPPRPEPHPAIEAGLAEARVLAAANQPAAELALLDQLEVAARKLGDSRVLARVLITLAHAQGRSAQGPNALDSLHEAHALAVRARDDALARDAALSIVATLFEFGDSALPIEGWLAQARVAHERLGRPASSEAVWLSLYEAQFARTVRSDYERAAGHAHEALALATGLDPDIHRSAASTRAAVHQELADLHFEGGDFDSAETHARLVIDWTAEAFGADHPFTKDRYSYLSDALVARGRYREALTALQTALEGARATEPHESTTVALLLVKSSVVHRFLERPQTSLEHAQEALRILETVGASPGMLIEALAPLAVAQQLRGDLHAARATGERIVAITEAELGPDHADLAPALYNLGDVLFTLGHYDAARARFERSLELAEATLGMNGPHIAYPLSGLGEIAVISGDFEAARELLTRARELASEHHDARLQARLDWAQARTLLRDDRPRAARLAWQARVNYASAGEEEATSEIDAWLSKHRLPGGA